jgi:hypothetical protein
MNSGYSRLEPHRATYCWCGCHYCLPHCRPASLHLHPVSKSSVWFPAIFRYALILDDISLGTHPFKMFEINDSIFLTNSPSKPGSWCTLLLLKFSTVKLPRFLNIWAVKSLIQLALPYVVNEVTSTVRIRKVRDDIGRAAPAAKRHH